MPQEEIKNVTNTPSNGSTNKTNSPNIDNQLTENIGTSITTIDEIKMYGKKYLKLQLKKGDKTKQMYIEEKNKDKVTEKDFVFDEVKLFTGNITVRGIPIYKGTIKDMNELNNKYFKGKGEGYFQIGQDIGNFHETKNILPNKIGGIQILKGKVFAYAEIHSTSQENYRILGTFYEIGKPIIYKNFRENVQKLKYNNNTGNFEIVYNMINTNFTRPLKLT